MLKIESECGSARTGKLKLASCTVKTPFFMPVATKAVGKYADAEDYESSNAECIISNSIILDMAAGSSRIEKLGGIHRFMGWKKGIFTDSGGFQMHSEHLITGSKKFGIEFRNPYTGKKQLCSPEDSMEIQQRIGSDVAMCLDDMPPYGAGKERIEESMAKTYDWALRCKIHHSKINKKGQLLFGICQGGTFPDLRKKSAEMITSIGFDGYAFGGLALGEPMAKMLESVKAGVGCMPKDKTRYLMGVGVPSQIIDAVMMGVDCFDSTYPTMTARHNSLLTRNGPIDIFKRKYAEDDSPVDEGCSCPACKKHSRAYMHHLARMGEPAGFRLRTLHNLNFMSRLMSDIRDAIKEGRLDELKNELENAAKSKGKK